MGIGTLAGMLAPWLVMAPPALEPEQSATHRYLTRSVLKSARFLDHGVLAVNLVGGWPSLYRVGLALGLADHLTIGATAHWIPGAPKPRWSPEIALALYRGRRLELGAYYVQTLVPPPRASWATDEDPLTGTYDQRVHYGLATLVLGQGPLAAGVDVGIASIRQPASLAPDASSNTYRTQIVAAAGLHVRVGTRRYGAAFHGRMAMAEVPDISAELALDVRFGLFELRPRGGWRVDQPGQSQGGTVGPLR